MTSLKTKGHCLQIWIRQPDVLNQGACGIMWPACYYRDFVAPTSEDHGTAAATQSSHLWFRPSSSSAAAHKNLPFYVLLPQELSSVVTWKLRRQPTPLTNPPLHIFFLLETLRPITGAVQPPKESWSSQNPSKPVPGSVLPQMKLFNLNQGPSELLEPSSTQGFISPCSFHQAVCPPSSPNQSKLSSAKGNDF